MPLNQQLCQAIDTNKKLEVFEGGEDVLTTERNMRTDRAMVTTEFNAIEAADPNATAMMQIQKEVQLMLKLEDLVQTSPRYETIFSGLKLNTAHNSAVMEPLSFMIRRIIYAALIVFMPKLPQVVTLALTSICVIMMVYSCNEKQWKEQSMQTLAIINEAFLYMLLILLNASACMPPAATSN